MKLLLLGSTGLLGQAVAREAPSLGWTVRGAARVGADIKVDIANYAELENIIANEAPDLIFNCAALVDIARCEEDPGLAYRVNSRPADALAEWSRSSGRPIVQVSTDHFYSSGGDRPHSEEEPLDLVNEYARTKYAGECFALRAPKALILRTSIVGIRGWAQPSFAEWAIEAVLTEAPITLFSDAFGSSIDVRTFAKAALMLASQGCAGILNLAATEVYSKENFVREVAAQLDRPLASAVSGSVRTLRPQRPSSLGLDVRRAEELLGHRLPRLDQVVRSILEQRRERRKT